MSFCTCVPFPEPEMPKKVTVSGSMMLESIALFAEDFYHPVDGLSERAVGVDDAVVILRRVRAQLVFGDFHTCIKLFLRPLRIARAEPSAELLDTLRHDEYTRRAVALFEKLSAFDIHLREDDVPFFEPALQVGNINAIVGTERRHVAVFGNVAAPH